MKNNLDPSIVKYVIAKYYRSYMHTHWDDLFSWGMEGLYRADREFDPTKSKQGFKYFAVCLIRRSIFTFVRDRISKTFSNTVYTEKNEFLEEHKVVYLPSVEVLDLYRALPRLTRRQKEVIRCLYYYGYNIKQTAKILNITPQSVSSRRDNAFKRLRGLL